MIPAVNIPIIQIRLPVEANRPVPKSMASVNGRTKKVSAYKRTDCPALYSCLIKSQMKYTNRAYAKMMTQDSFLSGPKLFEKTYAKVTAEIA